MSHEHLDAAGVGSEPRSLEETAGWMREARSLFARDASWVMGVV